MSLIINNEIKMSNLESNQNEIPNKIRKFVEERPDLPEGKSLLKHANDLENEKMRGVEMGGEVSEIAKLVDLIKETNDHLAVFKGKDEKSTESLKKRLEVLTSQLHKKLGKE